MKKHNQSTYPTHSNNTSNNTKCNNNRTYHTYNPVAQAIQQPNQFNHNQRQHSNRSRCQVIPPQQFLLPTQNQQRSSLYPTIYQQHQRFLPTTATTTTTTATMSSLTTSNFLQNQYTNSQNYTPYHSQQSQQVYQQQLSTSANVNRNQLVQQTQMLQQQKQQQQSELQFQRRQQFNLPTFSQNNAMQQMQQMQQNHQHQKRPYFEQQQLGNLIANSVTSNNHNNNCNNYNNNAINNNINGGNGGPNINDNEKFSMDATEIANFLANELFMQQLVSLDGIQSGVPTLTTATLTPTVLPCIDDSFIEFIDETVAAPFQATFIPPVYPSTSSSTTNNASGTFNGSINDNINTESEDSLDPCIYEEYTAGGDTTENSSATTDSTSFQNGLYKNSLGNSNSNSASANDFSSINVAISAAAAEGAAKAGKKTNSNLNTSSSATTGTTRRNQGGRRPAKPSNLTPEEEEKRRIRRERNKEAAARCRKRRVDLTNELLNEVSELEKRRDSLQKDITSLNIEKQNLEYIFEAHRPTCQKVRKDLLSVTTFGGLIAPNSAITRNSDTSGTIIGIDTTLASTGRSSPIDLKPEIIHDNLLGFPHIKNEPIDSTLDSNSLDHDGPPSSKRILLSSNNPMVQPPLPKIGTLSPSLAAAASATLNTPTVTTAPVSFSSFGSMQNNTLVVNTLNALNKPLLNVAGGSKQRPTTLPSVPRNSVLGLNVDNKAPTDINGVAIQTPSTGMFNFDSLMDGGTGLTPVSGPLVPTCSSQNKHPLELTTPTSEPSKLVSL